MPKRGFRPINRIEYAVVNLKTLERYFETGQEVNPEVLLKKGLVRKGMPVKVLGDGELTKALNVRAHAFSQSARQKIEALGGTCEEIK